MVIPGWSACTSPPRPSASPPPPWQVHLAAIVTAHRLVGLSLDPGHPSIALLLDGIRRRKGTRPARQATPISPAMLACMVRAQPATPLGLRNRAILLAGFGGALRRPAALRDRRPEHRRPRVRRRPGRRLIGHGG